MKNKGIVASFKVYPRKERRLYFTVHVFTTKRKMQEYCRGNCTRYMGSHAEAVCHSFKRVDIHPGKKTRVHPEIGSMHFYLKRTGPSVVAHECTHAAIFWCRRIERKEILRVGDESDNGVATGIEEGICLAVGELFHQIAAMFWKHGIWK